MANHRYRATRKIYVHTSISLSCDQLSTLRHLCTFGLLLCVSRLAYPSTCFLLIIYQLTEIRHAIVPASQSYEPINHHDGQGAVEWMINDNKYFMMDLLRLENVTNMFIGLTPMF